jgi:hypothetical protein
MNGQINCAQEIKRNKKRVIGKELEVAYILYLAFEEGSPLNLNSLSTI